MSNHKPIQPKVTILYNTGEKEELTYPWVRVKRLSRCFLPEVSDCYLEILTGNMISDISPDGKKVTKEYQYRIGSDYQKWIDSLVGAWIKVEMPTRLRTQTNVYGDGNIKISDILPKDKEAEKEETQEETFVTRFIGRISTVEREASHMSEVISCSAVDIFGAMGEEEIQALPIYRMYENTIESFDGPTYSDQSASRYLKWIRSDFPPFNRSVSGGIVGNKHHKLASNITIYEKYSEKEITRYEAGPLFDESVIERTTTTREYWKQKDVVDLVINVFSHINNNIFSKLGVKLETSFMFGKDILESIVSSIDTEGKSFKQIIDEAVPRSSGWGIYLDYSDPKKIVVKVKSLSSSTDEEAVSFNEDTGYPTRLISNPPTITKSYTETASKVIVKTKPATIIMTTNMLYNYLNGWKETDEGKEDEDLYLTTYKDVYRKFILKTYLLSDWTQGIENIDDADFCSSAEDNIADGKALNFYISPDNKLLQNANFADENVEIDDSLPLDVSNLTLGSPSDGIILVDKISDWKTAGNSDVVVINIENNIIENLYTDGIIKSIKALGRSITFDPSDYEEINNGKEFIWVTLSCKINPITVTLTNPNYVGLSDNVKVIEDSFAPIIIPKKTILGFNEDDDICVWNGSNLANGDLTKLNASLRKKADFYLKKKLKLNLTLGEIYSPSDRDVFGLYVKDVDVPEPIGEKVVADDSFMSYENYSSLTTNSWITKIVHDFNNQTTVLFFDYSNFV